MKNQISRMLKNAPEGKLRCAINKGYYQYYCGKKYLGKNEKEYIKQLAQKEYNIKLLDKIEEYQNALEELYDLYSNEELENVYRESHPARKEVISPIIKLPEQILYLYKVPYKYEMPLKLKNQNRIVTFYPDFTALNKRTERKFIIEHLGMMDKMSYYENAMRKIDVYEKNNILLGRDMILLHETSNSPLNVNVVRKYIEEYLC